MVSKIWPVGRERGIKRGVWGSTRGSRSLAEERRQASFFIHRVVGLCLCPSPRGEGEAGTRQTRSRCRSLPPSPHGGPSLPVSRSQSCNSERQLFSAVGVTPLGLLGWHGWGFPPRHQVHLGCDATARPTLRPAAHSGSVQPQSTAPTAGGDETDGIHPVSLASGVAPKQPELDRSTPRSFVSGSGGLGGIPQSSSAIHPLLICWFGRWAEFRAPSHGGPSMRANHPAPQPAEPRIRRRRRPLYLKHFGAEMSTIQRHGGAPSSPCSIRPGQPLGSAGNSDAEFIRPAEDLECPSVVRISGWGLGGGLETKTPTRLTPVTAPTEPEMPTFGHHPPAQILARKPHHYQTSRRLPHRGPDTAGHRLAQIAVPGRSHGPTAFNDSR